MKKILGATALAAVGLVILSGCSSQTGSNDTSPIKVGSINAISGPATFPEASQAAKAVFDQVNASGGINGRKISYDITDDKLDGPTASANARQIVTGDNAVALVGSASIIECTVNGAYYKANNIMSVQGVGIDPACFSSSNIAPVNVGPYSDLQMSLNYGSQILHLKKICALIESTGPAGAAYTAAIDAWQKSTGKKLAYYDGSLPTGAADYTSYVVKARAQGCDAIATNGQQPDVIAEIKAANNQGWSDVTFLGLSSIYTDAFAKAVGPVGKGVYVPSEFAPYTDLSSPNNKAWLALMKKNNIALTSFAQGGYLAATYFVQVLKTIKGDITRKSVTAALKSMKPISNKMMGNPWVFGSGSAHNPNRSSWEVAVAPGATAWSTVGTGWVTLK